MSRDELGETRLASMRYRISEEELAHRRRQSRDLLAIARPRLADVTDALAELPHVACLVDRDGIVIAASGSAWLPDGPAIGEGYDLSETGIGRNGAGSAVATGAPVVVEGPSHADAGLRNLDSVGAPIRDATDWVVGTFALFTPSVRGSGAWRAVVVQAARAIESGLRVREMQSSLRIESARRDEIEAVLRRAGSRFRHVVEALDDAVVIVTPADPAADARFQVEFVNAAARSRGDRPRESWRAARLDELLPIPLEQVLADPSRAGGAADPVTLEVVVDESSETGGSGGSRRRTVLIRIVPLDGALAVQWRDAVDREPIEALERELDREQSARADAEAARRALARNLDTHEKRTRESSEFLREIGDALASSLDYAAIVERAVRLAVPALADCCVIEARGGGEGRSILRIAAADADHEVILRELLGRHSRKAYMALEPVARARQSGQAVYLDGPDEIRELLAQAAPDDIDRVLLESLSLQSLMIHPLSARDRSLGWMVLATTKPQRRFHGDERSLATQVAHRVALALDNARLYGDAQRAIALRDDVLRFVSHDLRNPLNIIGFAAKQILDLLPSEASFGEVAERVDIVRRASAQMSRLVDDLLDVARIEAGHLAIEPRPEPVIELVRDAVRTMQPLASARSIRIEAVLPESDIRVRADRDRFHQVVGNLVGNAIRFTPEGGRVGLSAEPAGSAIRFCVTDTGPGIAAEHLDRVFDRFWQAREAGRAGAGLGLAIVKGIIEAHGGHVWVESEVGAGTSFYFTLPGAVNVDD